MTDQEINQQLAEIMLPYEAMLREQLGLSDDWQYRSLPFMTEPFYNELMSILGDGNVRIASGSTRVDGGETSIRASIFINEEGMTNLRAYNASVK